MLTNPSCPKKPKRKEMTAQKTKKKELKAQKAKMKGNEGRPHMASLL